MNQGPQRMTERNLREFDKITRREGGGPGDRDRPLSPGVSSIKSSRSLHELGLGNYPYPEIPASTKLTRSQERQSLQNLNNRLAGYIDKVNMGLIATKYDILRVSLQLLSVFTRSSL